MQRPPAMTPSDVGSLLKETFEEWNDDQAPRLAAAIAYYTLLSLSPLTLFAVAVVGLAFGQGAARARIVGEISRVAGADVANAVATVADAAHRPGSGLLGTAIGAAIVLFGASAVFEELQGALNTVWGVGPKPGRGLFVLARHRMLSFVMVVAAAALLLMSLAAGAVYSALHEYVTSTFEDAYVALDLLGISASIAISVGIFALIFKVVPDAVVRWRDVWLGALVTALLFTLGRTLLGLYLRESATASMYGAAGSIVVLVVWVYYSAQIFLFGAELTQVHARRRGCPLVPNVHAVAWHDD